MADDGRLGFSVNMDFSQLEQELVRVKGKIDNFTNDMISQYQQVDAVLSNLGKAGFDVSSKEKAIETLKTVISDMGESVQVVTKEVAELEQKIKSLASGDLRDSVGARRTQAISELNIKLKQLAEIENDINEKQLVLDRLLGNNTEEIGRNTQSVLAQTSAFQQMIDIFRQSTSPLQTFRVIMTAVKGSIKLAGEEAKGSQTSFKDLGKSLVSDIKSAPNLFKILLSSVKALPATFKALTLSVKAFGAALLANPIGIAVAALAALVKIIQTVISKTDSLAQAHVKVNERIQRNYDLEKKLSELRDSGYERAIKDKERELKILEVTNHKLEDRYAIEDAILNLREQKNTQNASDFEQDIKDVDSLKEKLVELRKALAAVENVRGNNIEARSFDENGTGARRRGWVRQTLGNWAGFGKDQNRVVAEIKGELVSRGSFDDVIKDLQGQIELIEKKIENAQNIIDEKADISTDRYVQEQQRIKENAKLERTEARATAKLRNSLIANSYAQQVASIKQEAKERREDLQLRLDEEELSDAQRTHIKDQIELLKKKERLDLAQIAHQELLNTVSLRRQVEDVQKSSAPLTAEQQVNELKKTYDRLIEDAKNQMFGASAQRISLLSKLQKAYVERYENELVLLQDKLNLERIANEKETIELRLASVKEGGEQEYQLQKELLEKERNLELKSNKALAEDKRQDEKLINAKYDKQLRDLEEQRAKQLLELERETIELRLSYVEKGTDKELSLRLDQIEKERQAELLANRQRAQDAQQRESDIDSKYYTKRLEAIKEWLSQNDSSYKEWLKNIDTLTVAELEKLLKASKDALRELFQRQLSGDITVGPSEIDALVAKISELEQKIKDANLTPGEKNSEYWKKEAEQIQNLGNEISNLGDAIGGMVGDVLSGIGTMVTSVSEGITGVAKLGSKEIAALEKASVILSIISVAMKAAQTLNNLMEKVGLDTKDPVLREYENYLREQEKKVKDLEREYDRLGEAISNAFGTAKSKLLSQQIAVAQQQLSKLIEEYERLRKKQDEYDYKKWYQIFKRDLSDEEKDRLEELGYAIEDAQNNIADLRQQAVDAIFGSDVQSAIEKFAEAYTNAWQNGTDAAEAGRDVVKEILKDVVTEALKAAITASGKVEEIRRAVALAVGRMMGGTAGTNIIADALGLEDDIFGISNMFALMYMAMGTAEDAINSAYATADELTGMSDVYRQIMEGFGLLDDVASDRSGQAAGLQSVSQESFDATSGRITSIQGHTFNISENSNIIRDNIAAINGNVAMIRDYTSHLVRMDEDMRDMKNNVQTIRQSVSTLAGQ